ncbi:MAG: tRNA uridine-5-carboxymethylaminomethyl(34) synthesis enzyme MnmG [Planctomycetes bacterium]|nr:tRNA uridine-5-carboxymethylaminomethyl(34) synthesis enzyme MnmG [Planctomycetota bacterium]
MDRTFDIVVIGGGHAGIEAAHAAGRLGARTPLLTMNLEAIGRMSCNPAIGGLGKGQMVCEIDALGGLMGRAIDATGIQFRLLNMSKGPAVRAPRAQADRQCYADWVRQAIQQTPNVELVEGAVAEVLTKGPSPGSRRTDRPRVIGLRLEDGRTVAARAVVIATGTFLRGLMHQGTTQTAGGRTGEAASQGISRCLELLGFSLGRLKTGTPPRVARDSLDYDQLTPQAGDPTPTPFSFLTDRIDRPQIDCWITYTNEDTHRLIRDNLHLAPMYSGQIRSTGPRYCPSIEDKVVRFADKPRHQLFLEPEGYDNDRIYCNGISTSLPAEVQADLLRTIPGLQRARLVQPGYAVEYDTVPTDQIQVSLESKAIAGLYLAGQINGTSGYEEAAGQGLIAGINAVRSLGGQDPVVLGRDEAYIGVMIDDLVTRPPVEPYRMFTSRAEYRLHLRADNADQRLTPLGHEWGLVQPDRWRRFEAKRDQISRLETLVGGLSHEGQPLARWLRRPEATMEQFQRILAGTEAAGFEPTAIRQILIRARYGGYLARQQQQIDRFRRHEGTPLPADLDYEAMSELRIEARQRLAHLSPATLGQAARISGINPADITVLWVYLTGRRHAPRLS